MSDDNHKAIIIVSILALFTFVIQYTFRSLDDNRLTSWQWTFLHVKAWEVYLIIVTTLIISYVFSTHIIPLLEGSRFDNKHVLLFVLSFITIVPFWEEPEVIVDASRYFTQAKHLELYGINYFIQEWGRGIQAWTDMPLIPFIYGLIFRFVGEYRICIQLFNTIIFSLTLVLTYLIGKSIWDEIVGFYGGLLLMGIPYIFTQVPLMLVDVHVMFLLTLSIYTFIKATKDGGIWIFLSSLSISLAFFSKYSVWLMMTVLFVIFLIYILKGCSPSKGIIVFSISLLLMGLFFVYKSDIFLPQIKLLFEYQKPGLRRWTEGFISTFLFQTHPFITAFALYSGYKAIKRRDLRYIIICYLVILIIILQIKRIRYIIPVFPMLTLMASYSMQQIDFRLRRFIVLCILTSSLSLSMFAYLPFIKNMSMVNLKEAGGFLNSQKLQTAEVITILSHGSQVNQAVSVPILDLFTKKGLIYHYQPDHLPSREEIETSSLRFTWEYKNPVYYEDKDQGIDALIVISGGEEGLPEYVKEKTKVYNNEKVFDMSEGVFQYRTSVIIYYGSRLNDFLNYRDRRSLLLSPSPISLIYFKGKNRSI